MCGDQVQIDLRVNALPMLGFRSLPNAVLVIQMNGFGVSDWYMRH
jgi:hypothetical protein